MMTLSTKNYALLTSKLQEPQWRLIDQNDRSTIRMNHGMPYGSPLPRLSRKFMGSLRRSWWIGDHCGHLERLQRALDAGSLLERLYSQPNTSVEQLLDVYDGIVADDLSQSSLSPPLTVEHPFESR
ncbi:hypothetical protein MRX96_046584 [Rhipicephalus microplus]